MCAPINLAAEHGTGQLNAENMIPLVNVDLKERSRRVRSGAIHQNIGTAKLAHNLLQRILPIRFLRHIGLDCNGPSAAGYDLIANLLRGFIGSIEHGYLRTGAGQASCHLAHKQSAGSGKNCPLALDLKQIV